jgi:hypothetical protein
MQVIKSILDVVATRRWYGCPVRPGLATLLGKAEDLNPGRLGEGPHRAGHGRAAERAGQLGPGGHGVAINQLRCF